jgi:hypothetical protein
MPIIPCSSRVQLSALWAFGNRRTSRPAELRREAKARGLEFREETWRGKGGHAMIWVGDKVTTLPAREIDPKTAKKIRKALGLD